MLLLSFIPLRGESFPVPYMRCDVELFHAYFGVNILTGSLLGSSALMRRLKDKVLFLICCAMFD